MTFNWWQTMLFAILLFAGGFFTRQWTFDPPQKPEATSVRTVEGAPDTSFAPVEALSGGSISTVASIPPVSPAPRTELVADWMYEAIIDTSIDSSTIWIRSRTYPFVQNDSLKAYVAIEFNITPRPPMIIERVDTVYVPQYVETPAEVPFLEKPVITIPVAFAAGVATAIIILNNTRKD